MWISDAGKGICRKINVLAAVGQDCCQTGASCKQVAVFPLHRGQGAQDLR